MSRYLVIGFWLFITHSIVGLIAYGMAPRSVVIQRPIMERIPMQPADAAVILQCPISKSGLTEWRRLCDARKRQESIKPKGM